jgi:hypothetical protein
LHSWKAHREEAGEKSPGYGFALGVLWRKLGSGALKGPRKLQPGPPFGRAKIVAFEQSGFGGRQRPPNIGIDKIVLGSDKLLESLRLRKIQIFNSLSLVFWERA